MIETVTARLSQGQVIGVRDGQVCRFNAIPYARPPLGELRFRPPATSDWRGELDARHPGSVAPQLPSRLRDAAGDFAAVASEDCLHLTLWTPAVDTQRRPV
ncbi:MAG: carboxylesterase family protein, partial [Hydrogenophaga sp.]|nr:carboxylesterase family protein [Hydrogenophaga sp.]